MSHFLKILNDVFKIYISVYISLFICTYYSIANQHTYIPIRQCFEWGMSMNDSEEMLADNAVANYLDADLDAT